MMKKRVLIDGIIDWILYWFERVNAWSTWNGDFCACVGVEKGSFSVCWNLGEIGHNNWSFLCTKKSICKRQPTPTNQYLISFCSKKHPLWRIFYICSLF